MPHVEVRNCLQTTYEKQDKKFQVRTLTAILDHEKTCQHCITTAYIGKHRRGCELRNSEQGVMISELQNLRLNITWTAEILIAPSITPGRKPNPWNMN